MIKTITEINYNQVITSCCKQSSKINYQCFALPGSKASMSRHDTTPVDHAGKHGIPAELTFLLVDIKPCWTHYLLVGIRLTETELICV